MCRCLPEWAAPTRWEISASNHYARLQPGAHGVAIHYVMDLAEIPTFELFQQWGPGADPQKKAVEQAREWAANLEITENGKRLPARVLRAQVALAEGAGNMQVLRLTADLQVDAGAGRLLTRTAITRGAAGGRRSSVLAARIGARA